jgi:hypothetical protein
MGKFKLKPVNPITLSIKKQDYVLYCKEPYQVLYVSSNATYTLQHVNTKAIISSKCLELGMYSGIYASDLVKITNTAAILALYGA